MTGAFPGNTSRQGQRRYAYSFGARRTANLAAPKARVFRFKQ